jgi:hypothetical protein
LPSRVLSTGKFVETNTWCGVRPYCNRLITWEKRWFSRLDGESVNVYSTKVQHPPQCPQDPVLGVAYGVDRGASHGGNALKNVQHLAA